MTILTRCKICRKDLNDKFSTLNLNEVRYACKTCGNVHMSLDLWDDFDSMDFDRYLLSALTREATEKGEKSTILAHNNIHKIYKYIPRYTTSQKLNKLLAVIGQRTNPGQVLKIDPQIDYPLVYAIDNNELVDLLRELVKNELVAGSTLQISDGFKLTTKGRIIFEENQEQDKENKKLSSTSNKITQKETIKARKTIDLTFIKKQELKKFLIGLFEEHLKCLENRCWKAAVMTSASVLEGILHDRILDKEPSAIMKQWTLGKYIQKADSIRLLDKQIFGSLPEALLDHRNTLHPENFLRTKFQIDKSVATILSEAVYSAMKNFGGHTGIIDDFITIFDFTHEKPSWLEHWPPNVPQQKWIENVGLEIIGPNIESGGGINKDIEIREGEKIIVRVLVSSPSISKFNIWLSDGEKASSPGTYDEIGSSPTWIDKKIKINNTNKVRIHLHCAMNANCVVHKVLIGTSV